MLANFAIVYYVLSFVQGKMIPPDGVEQNKKCLQVRLYLYNS